jgi:hypothetical protein
MTPTPAALELIASQKEFIAVATRQLLAAQLEMEKPNPYWNDVFNNVYMALGRVDSLRTVDATLQRMAGRNVGGLES